MVITAFIYITLTPVGWLLGLMPTVTLPTQLDQVPVVAAQLAGYVGQLSNWLPGYVLAPSLGFVFLCFAFHVTVRLARVVISHIPFIGGQSGG